MILNVFWNISYMYSSKIIVIHNAYYDLWGIAVRVTKIVLLCRLKWNMVIIGISNYILYKAIFNKSTCVYKKYLNVLKYPMKHVIKI